jgi:hypothetical protein
VPITISDPASIDGIKATPDAVRRYGAIVGRLERLLGGDRPATIPG